MDEWQGKETMNHFGYDAGEGPRQVQSSDREREAGVQEHAMVSAVTPSVSRSGQWAVRHSKPARTSKVRSIFLSFLSGAIVVGGLMWASDHYGYFSADDRQQTATVSYGAVSLTGAQQGQGSVTTLNETANADVLRPLGIPQLVDKASPAVVKIETYAKQQAKRPFGFSEGLFEDFFGEFFGPTEQQPKKEGGLQQVGSGSGFFFDAAGYILTNEHVIHGADEVRVVVDGRKDPFKAKVLGTAYESDLAVIKIESSDPFPILPLADSDRVRVGEWVVAIGNPYEFDHTVTVGVLSAKERSINIPDEDGTRKYQTLLQTDASINPGNSGGPLLNVQGEVIGINTAVNAQAQGIGFAIPTSTISALLESLKTNKPIPRPYIGVRMSDVPEAYLDDLGLQNKDGAFINEVVFGSPAYKAGLQMYDVVVTADGKAVKTSSELQKHISAKKPNDKVVLGVVRNKAKIQLTVTVGDMNTVKK